MVPAPKLQGAGLIVRPAIRQAFGHAVPFVQLVQEHKAPLTLLNVVIVVPAEARELVVDVAADVGAVHGPDLHRSTDPGASGIHGTAVWLAGPAHRLGLAQQTGPRDRRGSRAQWQQCRWTCWLPTSARGGRSQSRGIDPGHRDEDWPAHAETGTNCWSCAPYFSPSWQIRMGLQPPSVQRSPPTWSQYL